MRAKIRSSQDSARRRRVALQKFGTRESDADGIFGLRSSTHRRLPDVTSVFHLAGLCGTYCALELLWQSTSPAVVQSMRSIDASWGKAWKKVAPIWQYPRMLRIASGCSVVDGSVALVSGCNKGMEIEGYNLRYNAGPWRIRGLSLKVSNGGCLSLKSLAAIMLALPRTILSGLYDIWQYPRMLRIESGCSLVDGSIHGYDLGLPLCHSVWNISCPGTSVAEHITLCCAEHEIWQYPRMLRIESGCSLVDGSIHGYDLGLPLCHSVWNISCPGTSVAEHITLCCAEHEFHLGKVLTIKKAILVCKDTAQAIWGMELLAERSVCGVAAPKARAAGQLPKQPLTPTKVDVVGATVRHWGTIKGKTSPPQSHA
ncbi:hypothetical protein MTO96_018594 [Rhipicephalus appendiculatus]